MATFAGSFARLFARSNVITTINHNEGKYIMMIIETS